MPANKALVIFGATGDLAQRMLLPSLNFLEEDRCRLAAPDHGPDILGRRQLGPAGAFALTERNGHSWYE